MTMTNAINGFNSFGANYGLNQSVARGVNYSPSSNAVSRGAVDNELKLKKYSPEEMELANQVAMLNFNQGKEVGTTDAGVQFKNEGADSGSLLNRLASLFGDAKEFGTTDAGVQFKNEGVKGVDEENKLAASNPFAFVPDNKELNPNTKTDEQGQNLYIFA